MLMLEFRASRTANAGPNLGQTWSESIPRSSAIWPQMRQICSDELCIAFLPVTQWKKCACVYSRTLRVFDCRAYQSSCAALSSRMPWASDCKRKHNSVVLDPTDTLCFLTRNVHFLPQKYCFLNKNQPGSHSCSRVNRSMCVDPSLTSHLASLSSYTRIMKHDLRFKVMCMNLQHAYVKVGDGWWPHRLVAGLRQRCVPRRPVPHHVLEIRAEDWAANRAGCSSLWL